MTTAPSHVYVRYVDDIRVFCKTDREAAIAALRLADLIRTVGLVPNTTKTRIINTRTTPGWLRQPDYGQLQDERRTRALNRGALTTRARHLSAKLDFMGHARQGIGSPREELLVRRSLTQMLPDRQVIERIVRLYPKRPDLWDLFFLYMLDCTAHKEVATFAWKRLRLEAARDWECAQLIEVAVRNHTAIKLSRRQIATLESFAARSDLSLSQSQAAAALMAKGLRRPTATWLARLPTRAPHLANWLPALLRSRPRRPSAHRSLLAALRRLMATSDEKASLLIAYLAGTKLSRTDLAMLPAPASVYARIVLHSTAQVSSTTATDEISPLLRRLFNAKIPSGFDYRVTFSTIEKRGTLKP